LLILDLHSLLIWGFNWQNVPEFTYLKSMQSRSKLEGQEDTQY
jgi:hypothetical protein